MGELVRPLVSVHRLVLLLPDMYRLLDPFVHSVAFSVDDLGLILIYDVVERDSIRYDTIGEFNVDWKAEYSALSSTRSQKKKLKQPTPVPL